MSSYRSWFAVDGALELIDYPGDTSFRFPESLADHVIQRYSRPGDSILDPFCGFGTTLVVAERLGRSAVGVEIDPARARFAATRVADPARVVQGSCEDLVPGEWPPFDLVVTSPPYGSFVDANRIDAPDVYTAGAKRIFRHIRGLLSPDATIAVEVAQARTATTTRPVVWHLGRALSDVFTFEQDLVRINTADVEAGLGYDHSHVLVFRNR
jgi:adenine-specific DNA methylase